jgi:membrane protein implicated in regulation of membrane protease activity
MDLLWTPVSWLAIAMLMAILEIVVPGYLFFGFAIGAGAAALVVFLLPDSLAGHTDHAGLMLMLGWTLLSLLAWYGLRLKFGTRGRRSIAGKRDINDFENRS